MQTSKPLNLLLALLAGLVFGLGLILAGMANPAKVLAFLDLAGTWDPSLAFVMAGGIALAIAPFMWAKQREKSLLGLAINVPHSKEINKPLILGSLAFGVGWGLVGICPGPALVLLGAGQVKGLVFVVFMLTGMAIFEQLEARRLSKNAALTASLKSSSSS